MHMFNKYPAIVIGIFVIGGIFQYLGAIIFDHGNEFGGWAIIWGTIGSFLGIYVGFKVRQYF